MEQRYNYLYPADELAPWAERAREIASDPETREAYVITNNHYKGKAVANALMLKSMVTGQRVMAPITTPTATFWRISPGPRAIWWGPHRLLTARP